MPCRKRKSRFCRLHSTKTPISFAGSLKNPTQLSNQKPLQVYPLFAFSPKPMSLSGAQKLASRETWERPHVAPTYAASEWANGCRNPSNSTPNPYNSPYGQGLFSFLCCIFAKQLCSGLVTFYTLVGPTGQHHAPRWAHGTISH